MREGHSRPGPRGLSTGKAVPILCFFVRHLSPLRYAMSTLMKPFPNKKEVGTSTLSVPQLLDNPVRPPSPHHGSFPGSSPTPSCSYLRTPHSWRDPLLPPHCSPGPCPPHPRSTSVSASFSHPGRSCPKNPFRYEKNPPSPLLPVALAPSPPVASRLPPDGSVRSAAMTM